MASERRRRASAVLNLTPLIDIVFLLLVFFMLTSHFMRRGSAGWWFLAITLSLMIHGLLFVNLTHRKLMASPPEDRPAEPTHVRLAFMQPTQVPPEPETAPEPEPERKPEPEPQPEPKPEPELKPAKAPEIKAEAALAPKAKPKPKVKPKPKAKPKAKSKPVTQRAAQAARPVKRAPRAKKVSSAKLKKQYLATLLARIEKRKAYPKVARRRAIEGKIRVSFTVNCNGSVSKLNTQRGHKLLKRSAANAVKLAKPFPRPPAGVKCPLPVSYDMAFKLQ